MVHNVRKPGHAFWLPSTTNSSLKVLQGPYENNWRYIHMRKAMKMNDHRCLTGFYAKSEHKICFWKIVLYHSSLEKTTGDFHISPFSQQLQLPCSKDCTTVKESSKKSNDICFSVFFWRSNLSRIMWCTFLCFLILFILKLCINQDKDKIQRKHFYKQHSRTMWIP